MTNDIYKLNAIAHLILHLSYVHTILKDTNKKIGQSFKFCQSLPTMIINFWPIFDVTSFNFVLLLEK